MKTRNLSISQTKRSFFGCLCLVLALISGCGSKQSSINDLAESSVNSVSQAPLDSSLFDSQENAKAEELFERIYLARLSRSPIEQAFEGIREQQDKWDNYSDAFLNESNQLDIEHLEKLKVLNSKVLSEDNQLNLRLYKQELESAIEEFKWRLHRYPVSHMSGIHTGVATILIRLHRIETVEDAKAYIKRLRGVTQLFDQLIEGLEMRAEIGNIAPRFVYDRVIEGAQRVVTGQPFTESDTEDSPLLADFSKKLDKLDITESQKKQLFAKGQQALIQYVGPAYDKLIAKLSALQSRSETEGGAWKLPQGKAFYHHALRKTNTTEMDAETIHQLGLSEVARIHEEMKAIIAKVGYEGDLFDFFTYMQTEPRFFFAQTVEGKETYVDEAKRLIAEMNERLPELFDVMPKADIVVKPVEPFRERGSVGSAFYQQGAPDGSRPGTFYINTYDMSLMPKHALPSLAYHEGIPGHHMQVTIAQELENVPKFRRAASYVAYAEGWGLYAELLPKEIGLYDDLYADFGRLSAELWRACRLVVDTGLHDKRWTREQAITYLMENSPTDRKKATQAIERYLVLPSQATAYKIGMLKILELRQNAKVRLGDRFNIQAFHNVVLKNGSLPLNILEEVVTRWIDAQMNSEI